MRVLAIDHGTARCGCAISDPSGTIARPLAPIEPDPAAVARIAQEHEADLVVVGLPLALSGEEGHQAALARRFGDRISELLDVPVVTYDERLTTRMAERSARSGAIGSEDSIAAAHLLDSFLRRREREGAGR